MGQATVDLPDPLKAAAAEKPAAPGVAAPAQQPSPASADDLLAQLAGEEIDRLLAEAGAERPSRPARPDLQGVARPVAPAPAIDIAQPAASVAPTALPGADPAAGAILKTSTDEPVISRELDALFDNLTSGERPAPPPRPRGADVPAAPVATMQPAALPEAVAPAIQAPATDTSASGRTTIEEAAAVEAGKEIEAVSSAASTESAPHAAEQPTTTIADMATSSAEAAALRDDAPAADVQELLLEEGDLAPPPLYVRALELLNIPFDALPETLRDLLGKIAILTLFNSLAVLAYVLLFRRQH
jgi:hypothetical protein